VAFPLIALPATPDPFLLKSLILIKKTPSAAKKDQSAIDEAPAD
jgi:hypothetical protein